LLSIRQEDGVWGVPIRTVGLKVTTALMSGETLQPVRSKPFSHMVTGVVLRAFAAHPDHRALPQVRQAGQMLAERFFKPDSYPDRRAPSFWTSFSFPFWFTDLLSALDSLSHLGLTREHANIQHALDWLAGRQLPDGTWRLTLLRTKDRDLPLWIGLSISRVFKRFYS